MSKIILASSSKYRRKLLQRILKKFDCVAPDLDEKSFHSPTISPRALAELLAKEKALAIHKKFPDAIVIGSDQLVHFENQILGKPETKQNAVVQLENFSGKSHELITAVCVATKDTCLVETNVTRLTMKKLSHDSIQRYVDADLPLDCAGSYKIEKMGVTLFENLETSDPTAIEGLPLTIVTRLLSLVGIQIP